MVDATISRVRRASTISPDVTELIVVRHGETDWNRDGRYQGHADPPLNDAGREQARELARALADQPLDVAYTSDLRRAAETARIIVAGRGVKLVEDPGLREIDVGSWSGLTRAEIEERFPGADEHDGESRDDHLARVLAAVLKIARRHPGERVLIVSHGGSIGTLRRHALQVESVPRVENCTVYRLAFEDGSLRGID
jgi:probable phosphoglycerate mutase